MELMKHIPDKSVDMILCDLPYGITQCEWDKVIPLNDLWYQYTRIIKENGIIILTASQPFTSELIMSNKEMFKYELIWEKSHPTGHLSSNLRPLRKHENILIFSKGIGIYNPQGLIKGKFNNDRPSKNNRPTSDSYGKEQNIGCSDYANYPTSIIKISNKTNNSLHPTEKSIALFRYLIKTYTHEGNLVLDNCIGSGTTAVACKQTNRRFIGIEINPDYVELANKRLRFTMVGDFLSPKGESLIAINQN